MKPYLRDGNRSSGEEVFFPAPTKGLRTDSPLLGLAPEFAYVLDNMVVQPDGLVSRRGASLWAQGAPGTLPSLMVYNSATVSEMFVKTSEGIFNVSAAGLVGSAVHTSTAGDASAVNMATSAGQFLWIVNGVDDVALYDGDTWADLNDTSTPALTGVESSDLIHATVYRQRLFALARNFLGFYYLPVDSIAGAMTGFRIGSLCSKGGYAVSQATWTVDGGEGQDDFYAIATSEGQVVVFFGNNPGDLAAWDLRGVYDLGRPVGKNCFVKFGGDLLYLSEDGVVPMSAALVTASVNKGQFLSRYVAPSLQRDISLFLNSFGWGIYLVPSRALVIVNVPSDPSRQYVYNTQTKAWSTFSGWDALSWAMYNGQPYFINREGDVLAAFSTASDDGALIRYQVKTAFNRFQKMRKIRPTLARPFIAQDIGSSYFLGFAHDFENNYVGSTFETVSGSAALWDTALWDVSLWGGGFRLQNNWRTIPARSGVALSIELSGASATGSTVFLGSDLKISEHGLVF